MLLVNQVKRLDWFIKNYLNKYKANKNNEKNI